MNDYGTSSSDHRSSNGFALRSFFPRWRVRWLCLLPCLVASVPIASAQYTSSIGLTLDSWSVYSERAIVVKRNTWPAATTIYYFFQNQWVSLPVGPGQSDLEICNPYVGSSGSRLLTSRQAFSGLSPVGKTMVVTSPAFDVTVQFALTAAAKTSGPFVNCRCSCLPVAFNVTRTTTTSGTLPFVENPPVYISLTSSEGAQYLIADNGLPPDLDGDGIPDSSDPDIDGDGVPNEQDAFPRDPHESKDTDGDGIGDNADGDRDGDGFPNSQDAYPDDPTQHLLDTDHDGHPDSEDVFPDNPNEWKDTDSDGVGDNSDPSPSSTGHGPLSGQVQGDGHGNAGVGDGNGNPGPVPASGSSGTDTGIAGGGDPSGEVKPGVGQDVAGAGSALAPLFESKLGQFRPLGVSAIGRVSSYDIAFTTPRFGAFTYTFHFDQPPYTYMRSLMLIVLVYVTGRSFMKRITI